MPSKKRASKKKAPVSKSQEKSPGLKALYEVIGEDLGLKEEIRRRVLETQMDPAARKTFGAGQVFIRESSKMVNGKKVISFVGVMTLPEDVALKGEHQYSSMMLTHDGCICLVIDKLSGKDLTKEVYGYATGDLLTQPMWKLG